jgi:hypothetical protein
MARNPKVRANLSRQYRKFSPCARGCAHPHKHVVNPAGFKLYRKAMESKYGADWREHVKHEAHVQTQQETQS